MKQFGEREAEVGVGFPRRILLGGAGVQKRKKLLSRRGGRNGWLGRSKIGKEKIYSKS